MKKLIYPFVSEIYHSLISILFFGLSMIIFSYGLKAQIIYTDINPDSVIQATITTQIQSYDLDINNDGSIDLELRHFYPDSINSAVELYPKNGSEVVILPNSIGVKYPKALMNNEILENSNLWAGSGVTFYLNNEAGTYGDWIGVIDGYLGVRINLNGQFHYGWCRLDVPTLADKFIVKEYAYNSIDNQSIKTGQISVGINHFRSDCSFSISALNHNIYIETTDLNASVNAVVICDLHGRVQWNMNPINNKEVIIAKGFTSGFYLIKLEMDDAIISRKIYVPN